MVVLIPMILGYTVFVYRTFRGKVRPGQGYPRENPKGPRELTAAKLARRVPLATRGLSRGAENTRSGGGS
jgi:hypothetical protein